MAGQIRVRNQEWYAKSKDREVLMPLTTSYHQSNPNTRADKVFNHIGCAEGSRIIREHGYIINSQWGIKGDPADVYAEIRWNARTKPTREK